MACQFCCLPFWKGWIYEALTARENRDGQMIFCCMCFAPLCGATREEGVENCETFWKRVDDVICFPICLYRECMQNRELTKETIEMQITLTKARASLAKLQERSIQAETKVAELDKDMTRS
jgi:hypothetical protein